LVAITSPLATYDISHVKRMLWRRFATVRVLILPWMALVALTMIAACSDGEQDGWLAYRPSGALDADAWVELPDARYSRVADGERGRAVGLLAERAYVPLTVAQAESLVAQPLSIMSGVPVLVRAVRNSSDSGDFELLSDSESLVVRYGILGDIDETVHDGVVVVLEREPTAVFVELSAAR
jgi:hypothetical protein